MKVPFILPLLITRPVLLARSDRVHYVHYRSGDLKMLCWVYVVDGVRVGRCAASATTTWAPSMKEVKRKVGVMDNHHWKLSPTVLTSLSSWALLLRSPATATATAVSGDRLPKHTEGHRLNGRDVLSRKAGLRLGKDSTGVEEYPNQDKLHKISVLLWDLNPGLPDGRPRC